MADRILTRDTVTGVVSATLDPSTLGGGNSGIRFRLPSPVTITVPSDYQYLVSGALIIDPGAALTVDPGAQLVLL
jgi:hypothetical protein